MRAPTDTPWLHTPHRVRSIEERIILGTKIPPHLIAELMWEESNLRQDIPPRVEDNGTCSRGILQVNRQCTSLVDAEADVLDGLRIAEHWWSKSKHDWRRTKLAYRLGHLPKEETDEVQRLR